MGQNPVPSNWSRTMQPRAYLMLAVAVLPQLLAAQTTAAAAAPSTAPVADALRAMEQRYARILVGAAEAMPADKYSYRPTPAQMSFAQIQVHLINEGNHLLCSKATGVAAPSRTAIDSSAGKDARVARVRPTFQFCEWAF